MASGNTFITYIEPCGPFLKVWGQLDRNVTIQIEKIFIQVTPKLNQAHLLIPPIESIQLGVLCCAQFKDSHYYRTQIINTSLLHQNVVEVHFIDYGNNDTVPVTSLRILNSVAPHLLTIPPQAQEFILSNVTHAGSCWRNETIKIINEELRFIELQFALVHQIGTFALIKLYRNSEDALLPFFNRGFILSIATTAQHMIMQNAITPNRISIVQQPVKAPILEETMPTTQLPTLENNSSPAFLTYKSMTLGPDVEHNVYVSYVSDGPCQFYIQLQKFEAHLARLMSDINLMTLRPLEEDPLPGAVCVAKCMEDDHICRAVVTSIVDGKYKVFYVDFGNTETLPIDNLFQIPFKYVLTKVMTMRYSLANLEKSSLTVEMKCAFKDFVSDKLLRMRTVPSATRSPIQLCALWDQNNVNVLDVLRKAALLAYPDITPLTRGFNQEVHVSFVLSCNRFYVQLKSKDEQLRDLMADLQVQCPQSEVLRDLTVGLPCCALFDIDGQWYRAQIVSTEDNLIKVKYVDYGNEESVSMESLRVPIDKQVTALRPQAIECCLNGYQNMAEDAERDGLLEELILEKDFTMKVIEMQGNRALVELIDSSRYNVGSLLLEKLANARSQMSPMLIQDSHNIEMRKRSSPDKNCNQLQRAPSREKSVQPERSWRQERSPKKDDWSNDNNSFEKSDNNNFKQQSDDNRRGNNFFNRDKSKRNDFRRDDRAKEDSFGRTSNCSGDAKDKNWADSSEKGGWGGSGSPEKNWRQNSRDSPPNSESKRSFRKPDFNSKSEDTKSFDSSSGRKPYRRDDFKDKPSFDSKERKQSTPPKASNEMTIANPAPFTSAFEIPQVEGKSSKVIVSWFHDPHHFFCQLEEFQTEFRTMMDEIQNIYCKVKPVKATVGAPVVALFPEDNIMYRARVISLQGTVYKVQYVDFGNVSSTEKVWPIDQKYMTLPAQAICCSLNGIIPLDAQWPDSDTFSTYFSKDFFKCNFLSNSDGNYLVDLSDDDKFLAEILVTNNLAKYYETQVLETPILYGQQLRIMVVNVQDLNNISVQLETGIVLVCKIHNLAEATATYIDTMKEYVGQLLIMLVDNVLETDLEVTFYDNFGVKLKIIEPHVDDFVDMICPVPIYSSVVEGWVSYLIKGEGKNRVFIQFTAYSDTITNLLDNLFNQYNETTLEHVLIPEVDSIYAVLSSDGNWYRGQVTNVEEKTATVLFIDYGNSETLEFSQFRGLEQQFKEQHILALDAWVADVDESIIENKVTANVWYGENGWEVLISKENEAVADSNPQIQQTEVPLTSELTSETQIPQSLGVPVVVSHVDSPAEFYLQLFEAIETIENLLATIQEEEPSWPKLDNPVAGVLCAAPYSIDQQWYRAQVLDADSDITTVRFVDYGNTDVLDNTTTEVKTLPSDLLALEQHARRCSLLIKPTDEEWSPAACERFEALTSSENIIAEIVHQDEKTTYVELYADQQSVTQTLISENLATQLVLETESSNTGYVSHLNSPSEFWIQLENSVADLELIAERLVLADKFPELEDLNPGSLCAALFPDDEMWYRARILSNTIAGLEVLFIDYGNSCTCTGLRQLPEDLIMLPALAQKCSLQKPYGILQWSDRAVSEFRTISADGAAVFNIEKLSTGETFVIRLFLENEDISIKLLPITYDAYISHCESVSCFYVQKVEDTSKLDQIAEKLVDASNWVQCNEPVVSNDIVIALYPDDEVYYRARVLEVDNSSYKVLFVDYGNTAITSDIRVVQDGVETEEPLAHMCKLEPLSGYRWNEQSSSKLLEISNEGTTLFQVEDVSNEVVRMYVDSCDIRLQLECVVASVQNTPKKTVKSDISVYTMKDEQITVVSENNQTLAEFSENLIPDDQASHIAGQETIISTSAEMKSIIESCLEDSKFKGYESDSGVQNISEADIKQILETTLEGVQSQSEADIQQIIKTCLEAALSSSEGASLNSEKIKDLVKKCLPNESEVHVDNNSAAPNNSTCDSEEMKTSNEPCLNDLRLHSNLNQTELGVIENIEEVAIDDSSKTPNLEENLGNNENRSPNKKSEDILVSQDLTASVSDTLTKSDVVIIQNLSNNEIEFSPERTEEIMVPQDETPLSGSLNKSDDDLQTPNLDSSVNSNGNESSTKQSENIGATPDSTLSGSLNKSDDDLETRNLDSSVNSNGNESPTKQSEDIGATPDSNLSGSLNKSDDDDLQTPNLDSSVNSNGNEFPTKPSEGIEATPDSTLSGSLNKSDDDLKTQDLTPNVSNESPSKNSEEIGILQDSTASVSDSLNKSDEIIKNLDTNISNNEMEYSPDKMEEIMVPQDSTPTHSGKLDVDLKIQNLDANLDNNEIESPSENTEKILGESIVEELCEITKQNSVVDEKLYELHKIERSCTPHSEKIVPGSISRGDLSEVDDTRDFHKGEVNTV